MNRGTKVGVAERGTATKNRAAPNTHATMIFFNSRPPPNKDSPPPDPKRTATDTPSTGHLSVEGGIDYADAAVGSDRRRRMKAQQASRPDPNRSIDAGSGAGITWPEEIGAVATTLLLTLLGLNRFSRLQPLLGGLGSAAGTQVMEERPKSKVAV